MRIPSSSSRVDCEDRMKIEDIVLFAMSDDGNDYLKEPITKCVSHDSDEGCCILVESLVQPIRRAISSPNLLQIPKCVSRSRKKSDDSAVGSGEESEILTDKNDINHAPSEMLFTTTTTPTTTPRSPRRGDMVSHRLLQGPPTPIPVIRKVSSTSNIERGDNNLLLEGKPPPHPPPDIPPTSTTISLSPPPPPDPPVVDLVDDPPPPPGNDRNHNNKSGELLLTNHVYSPTNSCTLSPPPGGFGLRPPSVVVSDHDLCPEGEQPMTYLTLDDLDKEFLTSLNQRRLSDCSTCSTLSLNEPDFYVTSLPEEELPVDEEQEPLRKVSAWGKIRTIVHQLTPFIQTYKKQRYPWVQLAGHQGNFKAGEKPGTILKKFCGREKEAFQILMEDSLRPFVPRYYGADSEEDYIELEDLLARFGNPCVMDCKIGVRTYLEEELLKAKEKPKLRKDMYEKMLQIDRTAPTPEEHQMRGVTKPRYMVWRETISTTATLGFRIEGVRKSDGSSSKDFKTMRLESEVKTAVDSFLNGYEHVVKQYLERLHELRHALEQSKFFSSHEVIGSSLLFVHDSNQASVWMIDFAKTIPLPSGVAPLRHDVPWSVGNHEDGYLIGLTHLIKMFEELLQP